MRHTETHRTHRVGWLRAAVLGANDGIVSTASLIVGVAAAEASRGSVLVAGMAGLVAGAMSMAAGEYVSVSSQADTEGADLERERKELAADGDNEHAELAAIYVTRGLDPDLAKQVAAQLMARDALGAHARDELGISDTLSARPVLAAFASAGSFTVGAVLPLLLVFFVPTAALTWTVSGSSLLFLAMLGAVAARAGGSSIGKSIGRVTLWGRTGHGPDRRRGSLVRHGSLIQVHQAMTRRWKLPSSMVSRRASGFSVQTAGKTTPSQMERGLLRRALTRSIRIGSSSQILPCGVKTP